MTTIPIELWRLTVPATALIQGPHLEILQGRRCEISFDIESTAGATERVGLVFQGVEAFKCTYLTSCSAEMFNAAYGKLVQLDATTWLSEILENYGLSTDSRKQLRHLMICFDDGPCYEFICAGFEENKLELR